MYPGYFALIHENPHYCEQWLNWEERTIRSPTFPEKKTKSRSCAWLLRANEGYTIRVNVVHFQVSCSFHLYTAVPDRPDMNRYLVQA